MHVNPSVWGLQAVRRALDCFGCLNQKPPRLNSIPVFTRAFAPPPASAQLHKHTQILCVLQLPHPASPSTVPPQSFPLSPLTSLTSVYWLNMAHGLYRSHIVDSLRCIVFSKCSLNCTTGFWFKASIIQNGVCLCLIMCCELLFIFMSYSQILEHFTINV